MILMTKAILALAIAGLIVPLPFLAFGAGGDWIKYSRTRKPNDTSGQTLITKTVDYAMTLSDFAVYVDATLGPVQITLPESLEKGMVVFVQKVDDTGNPVIVKCPEGGTIDGVASLRAVNHWEGWTLVADGVNAWSVLSKSFSTIRTT